MQEKVIGAVCFQCGKGKYVKNPKTGKVFCDQKCWLGVDQKPNSQMQQVKENVTNNHNDKIEKDIKWAVALKIAGQYVALNKTEKSPVERIAKLANEIYKLEPDTQMPEEMKTIVADEPSDNLNIDSIPF